VVSRPLDVMFDLQKVKRFQDEQGAWRWMEQGIKLQIVADELCRCVAKPNVQ